MTLSGRSAAQRAAALALLGLSEGATPPQITHAYRRLARATHPDTAKGSDAQATRPFAAISDAYHLLLDHPSTEDSVPQNAPALAQRCRCWAPLPVGAETRPPIVAGPVTITLPADPTHARGTR